MKKISFVLLCMVVLQTHAQRFVVTASLIEQMMHFNQTTETWGYWESVTPESDETYWVSIQTIVLTDDSNHTVEYTLRKYMTGSSLTITENNGKEISTYTDAGVDGIVDTYNNKEANSTSQSRFDELIDLFLTH